MSTPALGAYIALYCREVLGDVHLAALSDEQFGRWVKYLCVMSEIGGRLPGDPAEIARRSRVDVRKVRHDLSWFPTFFIKDETDGTWRSVRLEKQVAKFAKKVEVARENGKSAHPEIGAIPPPDFDPYLGASAPPEMGANHDPEMGDIARGTQSHTQSLKEETKTTTTPLTPLGGAAVAAAVPASRARRPRTPRPPRIAPLVLDPTAPIDPSVIAATEAIAAATPTRDRANRPVRVDRATIASRLTQILHDHPRLDGPKLAQAWVDYVDTNPYGIKSPSAFFGHQENNGDGANWLPFTTVVWHRESHRRVSPPTPQPEALASGGM